MPATRRTKNAPAPAAWLFAAVAATMLVLVSMSGECATPLQYLGPKLLWSRNVTGGSPVRTSPAAYNGTVFIVAGTTLFALNAVNGDIRWTQPVTATSIQNYGTPAVFNVSASLALVYVGSGNQVYAFVAHNGSVAWSYTLLNSAVSSSPAIAPQIPVVMVGLVSDRLLGLHALTGQLIWNVSTETGESNRPGTLTVVPPWGAIGEDVAVFVACHHDFFKFSPGTGAQLWNITNNGVHQHDTPHPGTALDAPTGTLFFGSQGKGMFGVSAGSSPTVNYATSGGGAVPQDTFVPAVGRVPTRYDAGRRELIIVVGSEATGLIGYNGSITSGSNRLYSNNSCGARVAEFAPPTVDVDLARAYIGSTSAGICAFDVVTGRLQWRYNTGSNVASEILLYNGILYFADDSGGFYAVQDVTSRPATLSSSLSPSVDGASSSASVSVSASNVAASVSATSSVTHLSASHGRSVTRSTTLHATKSLASVTYSMSHTQTRTQEISGSQSKRTASPSQASSRTHSASVALNSSTYSLNAATPSGTFNLHPTPTAGPTVTHVSMSTSATKHTATLSPTSICETLVSNVKERMDKLLVIEPQGFLYSIDNATAMLNTTLAYSHFATSLLTATTSSRNATSADNSSGMTSLILELHVQMRSNVFHERFHVLDVDVVDPAGASSGSERKAVTGYWLWPQDSEPDRNRSTTSPAASWTNQTNNTTNALLNSPTLLVLVIANATPTYTNGISPWTLRLRISVVCSAGSLLSSPEEGTDGWPRGYPRPRPTSWTAQNTFNNSHQDDDWEDDALFEATPAGRNILSMLYDVQSPYIPPIPEPPPPRPVFDARVNQIVVTTTVALTSLSNPTGGTTIAKIGAAQRAAECKDLDPDGAKTNMEFGGDAYAKLRGAAAESFLIGVIPLVMFGTSVAIMRQCVFPYRSLKRILIVLHWPSVSAVLVVPSITNAIQPTLSIAVSVLTSASSSAHFVAWDCTVAALFLTVWVAYLIWWWITVLHRRAAHMDAFPCALQPRRKRSHAAAPDVVGDDIVPVSVGTAAAGWIMWAEGPRHWVPRTEHNDDHPCDLEQPLCSHDESRGGHSDTHHDVDASEPTDEKNHTSSWKSQYYFFFKDFCVPWYLFLDACMTTIVIVITAVPLSNERFCQVQLAIIAAAYLILLAVMNLRRAALGGVDFVYHNIINGSGAVGAMCLLIWANGAGDKWQQAFQVVSTVSMVVINVRILLDVIVLFHTFPKIDARLRRHDTDAGVALLHVDDDEHDDGHQEEMLLIEQIEEHEVVLLVEQHPDNRSVEASGPAASVDDAEVEEPYEYQDNGSLDLRSLAGTDKSRHDVNARDFLTEFYNNDGGPDGNNHVDKHRILIVDATAKRAQLLVDRQPAENNETRPLLGSVAVEVSPPSEEQLMPQSHANGVISLPSLDKLDDASPTLHHT